MKLIVGLGNIGKEYEKTKHNIGFDVVDSFAQKENLTFLQEKKFQCFLAKNKNYIIIKPTTYMNLSGESVIKVVNYYHILQEDILVVHDDLDLKLAKLRYRTKGSSGGHNGLKSIIKYLGNDFRRVKIGIGREKTSVVSQVLSKFTVEEREAVNNSIERACELIQDFVTGMADCEIENKYN